MFLTKENNILDIVLYSLSLLISVWLLPFISKQMNKRDIIPFNMISAQHFGKKPLRKAADRFSWCISLTGYFLFAFKRGPFKFVVADPECRNPSLNYDAA